MKIFIILFFLTIIVDVITLSGFITTVKKWLYLFCFPGKKEKNVPEDIDLVISLKPFDCVLCFTWWLCFFVSCGYIFGTYEMRSASENIFLGLALCMYSALLAYFSEIFMNVINIIKLLLLHLLDFIYEYFNLANEDDDDDEFEISKTA